LVILGPKKKGFGMVAPVAGGGEEGIIPSFS